MFDSQIITAKMEVTVTGEFYDPEASEETLRFCVEQGLIEQYSDVDVKLLKTRSQWISVKDRLPDDASDVLAYYDCIDDGRVMLVNYYKNCWYDAVFNDLIDDLDQGCITYWMPLPEPPKEAKQE